MKVSFNVKKFAKGASDKTIDRRLEELSEAIIDYRPALKKIAANMRTTYRRVFNFGGNYEDRDKWADLSERRLLEKQRAGKDNGVLVFTGRLKYSLSRRANPDHIEKITVSRLIFGTKVDYFEFHEYGNTNPISKAETPARRMSGYSERQKALATMYIRRHLRRIDLGDEDED